MKYMLSSLTSEFVFISNVKSLVPDSITRFNIGSGNGLLPVGAGPLSETTELNMGSSNGLSPVGAKPLSEP